MGFRVWGGLLEFDDVNMFSDGILTVSPCSRDPEDDTVFKTRNPKV